MVSYSNITLGEVFHEVISAINKYRSGMNIDYTTITNFVNRAVIEVVTKTLPFKDWAYVSSVNVTNQMQLPVNYLKYQRVLLSEDGDYPYQEARYVDIREYYTLTNWLNGHSWNRSSEEKPVFTIWGTGLRPTIFLAPNTDYQTGIQPSGHIYDTINVSGILEYHPSPDKVSLATDRLPIPYEFEDMVILSTIMRMYAKIGASQLLQNTQMKFIEETSKISELFVEKRRTEKRELDSFVEPVVPLVAASEEPGELKGEL
ncbi:hypothetical protein LCGC14_0341910 [marine sediment metagenome]|uniref:Uncharacterized protein n=1 Tax=marine sediment metagenome TaxID=412755 RepID=A0A0F9TIT2_9ZZZZ